MGIIVPPRPLTETEYDKARAAYNEGKRDLRDIDPVFASWIDERIKMGKIQVVIFFVGILVTLIMALVYLI